VPKDARSTPSLTDVAGANQLYIAFRDDALFIAIGKESLATLSRRW